MLVKAGRAKRDSSHSGLQGGRVHASSMESVVFMREMVLFVYLDKIAKLTPLYLFLI